MTDCLPMSYADPGFEIQKGGSTFLGIIIAPPMRGFPEATIKVYTCIFLGFRIAPPMSFFSWSHYKSLSEATIKVYT